MNEIDRISLISKYLDNLKNNAEIKRYIYLSIKNDFIAHDNTISQEEKEELNRLINNPLVKEYKQYREILDNIKKTDDINKTLLKVRRRN